jgi:hypothetical protein
MKLVHKKALLVLYCFAAFLVSTLFGVLAFDSVFDGAGLGMAILVGFAIFCQLMTVSIYSALIIDTHLDNRWLL